jgi:hypothetical protein
LVPYPHKFALLSVADHAAAVYTLKTVQESGLIAV